MEEQHEKMKERISPALSLVADKFCDDMVLELTVSYMIYRIFFQTNFTYVIVEKGLLIFRQFDVLNT